MLRTTVPLACLAGLVCFLTVPARLTADDAAAKQKQVAERTRKFEYPAAVPIDNKSDDYISQSVVSTPDDLDKVDAWYRKALSVEPNEGTGVSSQTRMIDADTPKERGIEVPKSFYINGKKPKDGDTRQMVPQTVTVRSFVVKEIEYTLVVVATRAKDDKATQISVTYIPAVKE